MFSLSHFLFLCSSISSSPVGRFNFALSFLTTNPSSLKALKSFLKLCFPFRFSSCSPFPQIYHPSSVKSSLRFWIFSAGVFVFLSVALSLKMHILCLCQFWRAIWSDVFSLTSPLEFLELWLDRSNTRTWEEIQKQRCNQLLNVAKDIPKLNFWFSSSELHSLNASFLSLSDYNWSAPSISTCWLVLSEFLHRSKVSTFKSCGARPIFCKYFLKLIIEFYCRLLLSTDFLALRPKWERLPEHPGSWAGDITFATDRKSH